MYTDEPTRQGTAKAETTRGVMRWLRREVIGVLSALLLLTRTALEDRALHRELPGYAEFAQQTRYRLLPGIW